MKKNLLPNLVVACWVMRAGTFAVAESRHVTPHVEERISPRAVSEEASLQALACSTIADVVAANEGRLPDTINGWRSLIEKNGGGSRSVFPISGSPALTDFDYPRFLLGSRSENIGPPWKSRNRTGELFIGLIADDADRNRRHLEFISWNPKRAAYDFGIIKDFNSPAKRKIITSGPEVEACFGCHKNQGPIYSSGDSWTGSIGATGALSRQLTKVFFDNAIHRSPEFYREAIALQKKGTPFNEVIAGPTIRLPDGEDTGFHFNDDPVALDRPIREANWRRRYYELLKEKTPEARENFFRDVLKAAIFGSTAGVGERPRVMTEMSQEIGERMKKTSHPAYLGDVVLGLAPSLDLMTKNPLEFVKQRRAGTLSIPPDHTVASADGLIHSSRAAGTLYPREMLNITEKDREAILKALASDVPADRIEKLVQSALRSEELGRILREGIPQREHLLSELVSALKVSAAEQGVKKTPALDEIAYVARLDCEHRWGQKGKPHKDIETKVSGACTRCHNTPDRPRYYFGFDPASANAWRVKLAGSAPKARAKLMEKLDAAIEYLQESTMPPNTAPEAKVFLETDRKKLLEDLRRIQSEK